MHCVPEIIIVYKQSIVYKVRLLFSYQGVYTHYYTLLPLIATLVALVNILFVRTSVDTYSSVISVDSSTTLCLKMQNWMRI